MTRESLLALLAHPAVERLGWTLVHFVWQGAAVAAVLFIVLSLLRARSPQARYAAACVAMAMLAVLPCVTYARLGAAPLRADRVNLQPRRDAVPQVRSAPTTAAPVFIGPVTPRAPMRPPSASPPDLSDTPYTSWFAGVWAAGVLLMGCREVGGWILLRRRVRRDTRPLDGELRRTLDELARKLRVTSPVDLVEAAWVQVPSVMGAVWPVILLPIGVLAGVSPEQLRALLAHELAHVRRHDYAVNLLQTFVQTVLFYHPAVWWVSARVREEREYCCDDVAAAVTGDRAGYARALAAMEESRTLPVCLAVTARGGMLLRRVRRLVGAPPVERGQRSTSRSLTGAMIAVACIAIPLAAARLGAQPAANAPKEAEPPAASGPVTKPPAAADVPDSDITPADLVPCGEYAITADDKVRIEVQELSGPGKPGIREARVRRDGTMNLPYAGRLKIAGMTEAEAEEAITKTYREKGVLDRPEVSVSVTEARGLTYYVTGEVDSPGAFVVTGADLRLLQALAAARFDPGQAGSVHVIRRDPPARDAPDAKPTSRNIRVPLDRLLAGDARVDIFVRPGDTIRVEAAPLREVKMIVGRQSLKFDDQPVKSEADLDAAVEKIPKAERQWTTLRVVPESEDLTLEQWKSSLRSAKQVAARYGLHGVVDDVFDKNDEKKDKP